MSAFSINLPARLATLIFRKSLHEQRIRFLQNALVEAALGGTATAIGDILNGFTVNGQQSVGLRDFYDQDPNGAVFFAAISDGIQNAGFNFAAEATTHSLNTLLGFERAALGEVRIDIKGTQDDMKQDQNIRKNTDQISAVT